jgi:D-cysteine desulfhydrase
MTVVAARLRLATLPTPLVPAPRLSDALGVEVWLKRDDLTGIAFGGCKARPVEFLLAAAAEEGADSLVTGGGPRSNWLVTAAVAGIACGLEVDIAMFGRPDPTDGYLPVLTTLPGVRVGFTGDPERASVDPAIEELSARRRRDGGTSYVVGRGGATPMGAVGYLAAVAELEEQFAAARLDPGTVWLATGSCGTQAGLVAGYRAADRPRRVVGVTVHRPADECRRRIDDLARGALELAGSDDLREVDWEVVDDQLVPEPNRVREAMALMATTEAVLLDPEFGGPALASLVVRVSEIEGPVVFLVSGGSPNLLARSADREPAHRTVGDTGGAGS